MCSTCQRKDRLRTGRLGFAFGYGNRIDSQIDPDSIPVFSRCLMSGDAPTSSNARDNDDVGSGFSSQRSGQRDDESNADCFRTFT